MPVRIVIRKRDARNVFRDVWSTKIDPADKFVARGAEADAGPLIKLHESGDPANKLDVLILGDGYTARERAKFERDAKRLTATLLATSPFKERQRDINVWGLSPAAAQSGISRPSQHIYRRSPIGATYMMRSTRAYVLTSRNKAFRDIAANAPHDVVQDPDQQRPTAAADLYGRIVTSLPTASGRRPSSCTSSGITSPACRRALLHARTSRVSPLAPIGGTLEPTRRRCSIRRR
jgi:hypothetical protein